MILPCKHHLLPWYHHSKEPWLGLSTDHPDLPLCVSVMFQLMPCSLQTERGKNFPLLVNHSAFFPSFNLRNTAGFTMNVVSSLYPLYFPIQNVAALCFPKSSWMFPHPLTCSYVFAIRLLCAWMNDDAVEECHFEFTVVLMGDINPDTKHRSLTPDIHRPKWKTVPLGSCHCSRKIVWIQRYRSSFISINGIIWCVDLKQLHVMGFKPEAVRLC